MDSRSDQDQPNVILVTMDSVRYDYYRNHAPDTLTGPTVPDFETISFSNAYANAPYTPASVPSFLTSRLPLEDGHVMHSDLKTLPEYFRDAGYTTILGFNNVQISRFGVEKHFDTVVDYTRSAEGNNSSLSVTDTLRDFGGNALDHFPDSENVKKIIDYWLTDVERRFTDPPESHPPDDAVIDELLQRRDEINQPYFLWVHMMDTHHPYVFDNSDFARIADEGVDRRYYRRLMERAKLDISVGDWRRPPNQAQRDIIRQAYEASILKANQNISRLLSEFGSQNSVVVITSDHGEEFWERGFFGHAAAPSKPRNMTLNEEMIHIPFFIAGPQTSHKEISTPVALVDLLPTLLDAAGIRIPSDIRGRSLIPMIKGKDTEDRQILAHATSPGDPDTYYEKPDAKTLGAAISDNIKYTYSDDGKEWLHDLTQDPREISNEVKSQEDLIEKFRSDVQETLNPYKDSTNVDGVDDNVAEKLRELGYLS